MPVLVVAAEKDDPLTQARVHLQHGRYAEALEALDELEKAQADPIEVALIRSRAPAAEGDYEDATKTLDAAARANPKAAKLWANLAELQFQRGQFDAAEKSVLRALQLEPEQPLARLVQADLYKEAGKLKEADEAYRWFVRYYNRVQPTDAETLLIVARGSVQYARWHSVSQIFSFAVNTLCTDALKSDENCWQASWLSGSLLLEKYNRSQGVPELQAALKINPRAAEVLAELGHADAEDGKWESAKDYAEQALAINPRLVAALQLQADIHLNDADVPAALKVLQEARAANPHDQGTLGRIAACYVYQDGLPDAARLEKLLGQFDRIRDAKLDQPTRFEQLLVSVAERNPKPGEFLTVLAKVLDGGRKYDLAETFYKQAISRMPQLSEPKTELGMLYMRTGRTEEARKLLDDAFKADPYHVRVSNMRKVLSVLEGYETISTDHFVIRVDSELDKLLGQYMADYLEEVYAELTQKFGYEPPHRTTFEIYNKAKGLSAHQWFSARMVGLPWIQTIGASTGMIVALTSPTAADEPFNWARVLKHEFVHIVTLQETNFNIPHWFTEALAVGAEGYPRPASWNKMLLERVPKGELRNLDNLNQGFIRPASQDDWNFTYCQSQLYAEYFVERFGPDALQKLLDAYRRNRTTDQALREVFQIEKPEFEKGYREYLSRVVSRLEQSLPEVERTPAEIEKAFRDDRDDPAAAAAFAELLLQQNQPDEARRLASQALEKEEKQPLAAVVLAKLDVLAGRLDAAAKGLEAVLDHEQPDRRALDLLAQVRVQQGDFAAAGKLYELGRRKFPYDSSWLKGVAAVALQTNDRPKLKASLEELSQLEADEPTYRKKLAELALEDKDYTAALRYAKLTLHIDVLDADVHRLLAEAHVGLKDYPRAVAEYQVALELKPGDNAIELGLAETYQQAGQIDEARTHAQNVLERDPENQAAKKLLNSGGTGGR